MVPHVFSSDDLRTSVYDARPRDVSVRSVCCGPNVVGGEPIKGDWRQPFPCFMEWHTTGVDVVKEQYNGVNILRCDPGPGGKCQRKEMQHRAHYQHLFDNGMKYNQIDKEDQKGHLKRKREHPPEYYSPEDLDYMGRVC